MVENNIFEKERQEYLKKLEIQIEGIDNIIQKDTLDIITFDNRKKLKKISETAKRLKDKIGRDEFEISIVGLEKSGKSTFANAMMGNNILPTKDERCTYTATSIRYGDDNAVVEFFNSEEFNENFYQKLDIIGIKYHEKIKFSNWSMNDFENYLMELELNSDKKNIANDVREILENKSSILDLIDRPPLKFKGESLEKEVKEYIEEPSKAIAVKEIVINSSKFAQMKNAVIYDVPGFDSPTQIHKDMTVEKMKQADAIMLVVTADKPSFNDSLARFMDSIDTDNDGIKIADKTFVFANRADGATTLSENIQKIKNELEKYGVMDSRYLNKRIIPGSAKARIDKDNNESNSQAIIGIEKNGITDGIDEIINILVDYNKNERFEIIKERVSNLGKEIKNALGDITNIDIDTNTLNLEYEIGVELMNFKDNSQKLIDDKLGEYRDLISYECKNNPIITDKVKSNIIEKITKDKYYISDDEIRIAQNKSQSGIEVMKKIDAVIREDKLSQIYGDFIEGVINLAVDEHNESEKCIINTFVEGFGISKNNPQFNTIVEKIKEYIKENTEQFTPNGYYNSLIRRYSRDLFEILIAIPYGISDRFTKFEKEKTNYYSLALFGDSWNEHILPGLQSMHFQILFHEKLNEDEENVSVDELVIFVEKILGEVIAVNDDIYTLLEKYAKKYGNNAIDNLRATLAQFNLKSDDEILKMPLFEKGELQNSQIRNDVIAVLNKELNIDLNELKNNNEANDEEEINDTKIEDMENLNDAHVSQITSITEGIYRQKFAYYKESLDAIKEEFAVDIEVLHSILQNQVMNAISIETPFIDLVKQKVSDLKLSLKDKAFTIFVHENKELLMSDRIKEIMADIEKRKNEADVINGIKIILNSID